ncbi:MAG: ECF transporter S component [Saccharofermentanales bacterium]|jgi:riboflavin transporter FmnP
MNNKTVKFQQKAESAGFNSAVQHPRINKQPQLECDATSRLDSVRNQECALATRRRAVRYIAKTGVLAAIAVVLMYLEFSVPLMPTFLKLDFSEVAVLLAAFSMGPVSGIIVEAIKNLVHLPATFTGGIGELANFVIGSLFVGTAGLLYKKYKTKHRAWFAMAMGTLVMTVGASLINYFIMIPIYVNVVNFPLPAIIAATNAVGNTLVTDLKSLILFVFVPFNIFKGTMISLIVAVIYKRISPLLHR